MTTSKFDAWQKIVDDYCQTKNCTYYNDDICRRSTSGGSCGVLKIKKILSGEIVVLDKADVIMAIINQCCTICQADHKHSTPQCYSQYCVYEDLKLVGGGKFP